MRITGSRFSSPLPLGGSGSLAQLAVIIIKSSCRLSKAAAVWRLAAPDMSQGKLALTPLRAWDSRCLTRDAPARAQLLTVVHFLMRWPCPPWGLFAFSPLVLFPPSFVFLYLLERVPLLPAAVPLMQHSSVGPAGAFPSLKQNQGNVIALQ